MSHKPTEEEIAMTSKLLEHAKRASEHDSTGLPESYRDELYKLASEPEVVCSHCGWFGEDSQIRMSHCCGAIRSHNHESDLCGECKEDTEWVAVCPKCGYECFHTYGTFTKDDAQDCLRYLTNNKEDFTK